MSNIPSPPTTGPGIACPQRSASIWTLITWQQDRDGRPILVSLIDLGSGDIVTLAVLDSQEMREPHTLLAFTVDGELAGHGPCNGEPAAASFAAHLALQHPHRASTPQGTGSPCPLHPAAPPPDSCNQQVGARQPPDTPDKWQGALRRAACSDAGDAPPMFAQPQCSASTIRADP
jgi:hypothetical protein